MIRRHHLATAAFALLAISVIGIACGGGGGEGDGPRITDPAAVPTSTPITNPVIFRAVNDIVSVEGATSTVRAGAGSTPVSQNRTRTVASGDTCAGIAAEFGITVDELRRANRTIDANCSNLKVGDVLRIPAPVTPTPVPGTAGTPRPGSSSGKEHVVVAGDTCAGIAAQYSVTTAALISANSIDAECTNLKIGQKLRIP